jgi:Zn-finger nucleic acid-binding protein
MSNPYRDPPPAPYRSQARVTWRCPRCEAPVVREEHADVRLEVCTRCAGMFVTHEILNDVLERPGSLEELRAVLPRSTTAWAEGGRMYVQCPACEVLMNRRQYATGARVVIDVCKQHGLWFDAGELPRVLDFIADGGLAQAARRDAELARQAEKRAQARREQDQLDLERTSSHSVGRKMRIGPVLEALLDLLL